jgi:hypothetical protein
LVGVWVGTCGADGWGEVSRSPFFPMLCMIGHPSGAEPLMVDVRQSGSGSGWLLNGVVRRLTLGIWSLSLPEGNGSFPHSLEAVKIGGDHVAVFRLAEAEDRGTSRRHAIYMLIDEQLVVSAVDRVV